jgi:hypothetical protein
VTLHTAQTLPLPQETLALPALALAYRKRA